MSAGIFNFEIQRGTTFNEVFSWQDLQTNPINLTGYSLLFRARAKPDITSPQLIQYTSPCQQLSITNPLQGQFSIFIPAGDTATYQWTNAVYDIILTSPAGVVTQLLAGSITVLPMV